MSNLNERNPIYRSGLPASAILLYFYLERHGARNNKCFHSIKTISNNIKINERTIIRAIKQLERSGWIMKTHRYTQSGGKASNLYLIVK